ncbi:MAG: HEPN domain-containing protein [Candidatus Bathyarchaeia archaeon]
MNKKNWQVSFIIKGLIVPNEEIAYGDVIIKRCGENVDEAQLIMKVTKEEVEDKKTIHTEFEKDVANILQLYALETGRFVALPSGYAASPITNETPFGKIPPKVFTIKVEWREDPRIVNESCSALKYALRAYESLKSVFEDSSKAFIRHGIKYYYMALAEHDIQRKIIDLFIALEALFSVGEEVRFRTSLRISLLLSFLGLDRKKVFDTVYELYYKRSKIVHGVENVDVSWDEVNKLERYLRDCLRVFLFLDKGKDEILDMLDDCLIEERICSKLKETIITAYKRWEAERSKKAKP